MNVEDFKSCGRWIYVVMTSSEIQPVQGRPHVGESAGPYENTSNRCPGRGPSNSLLRAHVLWTTVTLTCPL